MFVKARFPGYDWNGKLEKQRGLPSTQDPGSALQFGTLQSLDVTWMSARGPGFVFLNLPVCLLAAQLPTDEPR